MGKKDDPFKCPDQLINLEMKEIEESEYEEELRFQLITYEGCSGDRSSRAWTRLLWSSNDP